jgi:hypothetical protein
MGTGKRSVLLVLSFFIFSPIVLGYSLFLLYASRPEVLAAEDETEAKSSYVYASRPSTFPVISASVQTSDARAKILEAYLTRYHSPLSEYSSYIVETADQNDVDFRLVVAIAQQESNLCKFIPEESYNCWGWGIHSQGSLGFTSYEEGIRIVTEGLKQNYIDKGLTTPEAIMSKYTPQSNGSWAHGVSEFMSDME